MKGCRQNHSRRPKGFTLVELIVSMVIFTLFIGVIASTFFLMNRTLRQAAEVRKVYAEARFLMDKLTQNVRLYTIDYACLEDSGNPSDQYGTIEFGECTNLQLSPDEGRTTVLPLISADGLHRVIFKFEEGGSEDETGTLSILELDKNIAEVALTDWVASAGYYDDFVPFKTSNVELKKVQFIVSPLSSPYTFDNYSKNEFQFQPSVNVVIQAQSMSDILPETVDVMLQSTISSRVYGVSF